MTWQELKSPRNRGRQILPLEKEQISPAVLTAYSSKNLVFTARMMSDDVIQRMNELHKDHQPRLLGSAELAQTCHNKLTPHYSSVWKSDTVLQLLQHCLQSIQQPCIGVSVLPLKKLKLKE